MATLPTNQQPNRHSNRQPHHSSDAPPMDPYHATDSTSHSAMPLAASEPVCQPVCQPICQPHSKPTCDETDLGTPALIDSRRSLLAGIGVGLGGLAASMLFANKAHAGPLDPPPGPIISTGKTLNEVEPRTPVTPDPFFNLITISQPGSYYLTRSFTGRIVVNASDVTLDLNGFTVTSPSQASINVIYQFSGVNRMRLRNGRVVVRALITSRAIFLESDQPGNVVEDIDVFCDALSGASIQGLNCFGPVTIRRVRVQGLFAVAMLIKGGTVSDCSIIGVAGSIAGIDSTNGISQIERCFVSTTASGIGIDVASISTITDCTVLSAKTAIRLRSGCRVTKTFVSDCGGFGIEAELLCTITDSTVQNTSFTSVSRPGIGIVATERLRLERCTIVNNASGGVRCSTFDFTATDCSVLFNGVWGIDCIGPAQIERCHFANNNSGAIRTDQLTRVSACHIDFNGDFGVQSTATNGTGLDVVDCTITRNTTGVSIAGPSGNMVRRCTFAGHTTAISAPAGNFAPLAIGTAAATAATNPNVNIAL